MPDQTAAELKEAPADATEEASKIKDEVEKLAKGKTKFFDVGEVEGKPGIRHAVTILLGEEAGRHNQDAYLVVAVRSSKPKEPSQFYYFTPERVTKIVREGQKEESHNPDKADLAELHKLIVNVFSPKPAAKIV